MFRIGCHHKSLYRFFISYHTFVLFYSISIFGPLNKRFNPHIRYHGEKDPDAEKGPEGQDPGYGSAPDVRNGIEQGSQMAVRSRF